MKKTLAVLLAAGLLLATALPALADGQAQAQKAALAWLELLDQGQYGQAWDQAAPLVQKNITRAKWEGLLKQLAAKTGPAGQRKLLRSQAMTNPPDAPPGNYVLLTYAPGFPKSPMTLEQLALRQGPQGQWRVAGYFLK